MACRIGTRQVLLLFSVILYWSYVPSHFVFFRFNFTQRVPLKKFNHMSNVIQKRGTRNLTHITDCDNVTLLAPGGWFQ